jgi:hypothetical protein
MNSKAIDRAEMELFSMGLLADGKGKLSTTAKNTAEEIASLAFGGIGNKGETRWDLFNGITERYTRGASDNTASAFVSSEFGTAADTKAQAFDSLMDDATFDALVANGERLLKGWEASKTKGELVGA